MKKLSVFFDSHAETWDSHIRPKDISNIEQIIKYANLSNRDKILDVGTGTGVLIPFLKKSGVKHITAVDFSEGMTKVFKRKFNDVDVHNADYEQKYFDKNSFSKIIIFNTFPHFSNYEKVFQLSYEYLMSKGTLIIAHSMSRKELNQIHKDAGKEVEKDVLISDDEFTKLYSESGFLNVKIISNKLFFASGIKK